MPDLNSFREPFKTMLEATSIQLAMATEDMNAIAAMYGISIEEKTQEELRRDLNTSLAECLLSGTPRWWAARKDVARVLVKRDGTVTIFARSHPRLTRSEVIYLREELCFCGYPAAKLIAIWKD